MNTFSTAIEMLAALREKRISAVELLEEHIQQVERANPALNAIVITNYEEARRCAQQADQARARGHDAPLLGLPVTAKDWIEAAGLRSTAGDPGLAAQGYIAQRDCLVLQRLKEAGAVLFAKTNMAPWGGDWITDNPVFGRSNNPWNLEHTPGGSTGGGAAAVAAGMTPLEIGNDIGGSVRIPPAFCGVYGHKPSETTWPRSGQTPDASGRHLPNPASGLAVMGPLARSAEDLALAVDTAAGPDVGEDAAWSLNLPRARHERLRDFRVAVMPRIPWLPVDDEILEAIDRLVEGLRREGVRVEVTQPEGFGDLIPFYQLYQRMTIIIMIPPMPTDKRREIAEYYRVEAEKRGDQFMAAGGEVFDAWAKEFLFWYGQRETFRAAYRDFFRDWDVLLSPVTITNAIRHDEYLHGIDPDDRTLTINGSQTVAYGRLGVYASLATLCGQPATAFPFGRNRAGLPIGIQAVGPYLEDHTPLRFAALVARVFGGYEKPDLS